jgi:hypothetical protein
MAAKGCLEHLIDFNVIHNAEGCHMAVNQVDHLVVYVCLHQHVIHL